ncbi:unnamed protein product [Schistosoma mattheei]|uniref:Small ribosomal subunit protein mS29 n=1 Tax=Schistosoma mattheei TaxID=31246 RepID=A0A183NIF9_9TREM|nr:unnamed protein product [Schistosoma mattheei]
MLGVLNYIRYYYHHHIRFSLLGDLSYLLGKSGFEYMDPFIPVHVENYTPTEINALLRFYAENNWLTNPAAFTPNGQAELIFLSDYNPLELSRLAAEW